MALDVAAIRRDFPLLDKPDPPAFLDNACMTLKPRAVIDAVRRYYEETPFCAGRSVYAGALAVADLVADARAAVLRLLDAGSEREVVWTKNATEAINLVARAAPLAKGDVVLTTDREHNSNLVPWQLLAKERGVKLEVLASRADGSFDLASLEERLARGGVKLLAMRHASNLDGALVPAREIVEAAHEAGARVLLDGAQAAAHHSVSLRAIDADYYAVSAHKMLGPTGVGALVATREALDALGPFLVGGDTVERTTYDSFELAAPPERFEAGLQNYAGLAAVPAAVEYLERVSLAEVERHERALTERLDERLRAVPGVTVLGPRAGERGGITAFTTDFLDAHEVAILLDDKWGVLVRSGDHCAHSWFNATGVPGAVRASTYLYNTQAEVDRLADAIADLSKRVRR